MLQKIMETVMITKIRKAFRKFWRFFDIFRY